MGISSSKSKTEYNKQASPYMYGAANNLQSVVGQNAAGLQSTANDMQGYGAQLGSRVFGANPLADQAKAYAGDVLGGKYLNNNPYMNQMVDQARSGAFDAVNSGFGRSGMAGGTGHMQSLGRGIAQAELGTRANDYQQQQSRMDAMANNAGAISVSDLSALPYYMQTAQTGATLPYVGAQALASGMGGLLGNQQTTTQKQGWGGALAGLVGTGLSSWASGGFG